MAASSHTATPGADRINSNCNGFAVDAPILAPRLRALAPKLTVIQERMPRLVYFRTAIRPRRRVRLATFEACGRPPSSRRIFRSRARSSSSMSTNSNAMACGRAPRTIACALIVRTPCVSFSPINVPGARCRSPAPMPPPRFNSGTVSRKFSRKFVVISVRFRLSFSRA